MPLQIFLDRYLPPLEAEMKRVVQADAPSTAALFGMLRYHLGWADVSFVPCRANTGKRVRPVLCLLACESCGGDWQQAVPAAAAIELVHNFSLIHDDIEDRDATRRGRATVWALWGDAHGINAGDALFTLAQLALLGLEERGVPPATVMTAVRLLNQTCLALTCGQFLDIGFEGRKHVSTSEYMEMVEGKTAALVACACEMGAIIASSPTGQREGLRSFGRHLGLAFQMEDDVLGIWGDPSITGKPVGSDIARRKKTLPIVHGLNRRAELDALLAKRTPSDADVRRATELLEEVGSREHTEQLAQAHHDKAMAALEEAELHGEAASALREMARALLNRDR